MRTILFVISVICGWNENVFAQEKEAEKVEAVIGK